MEKPKIYVSGKISGLEISEAKHKFKESCKLLAKMGFEPVNPFDISETHPDKTWEDYMIDDIRALFDCKAIYMQNDWGTSLGARVEYAIAREMGKQVIFQPDFINFKE